MITISKIKCTIVDYIGCDNIQPLTPSVSHHIIDYLHICTSNRLPKSTSHSPILPICPPSPSTSSTTRQEAKSGQPRRRRPSITRRAPAVLSALPVVIVVDVGAKPGGRAGPAVAVGPGAVVAVGVLLAVGFPAVGRVGLVEVLHLPTDKVWNGDGGGEGEEGEEGEEEGWLHCRRGDR